MLIFRAYNDGVAYRFVSTLKQVFTVQQEEANFNFTKNHHAFIPYVQHATPTLEEQFGSSFENTYSYISLNDWNEKRLAFTPLLVECDNGLKVAITDADLIHYPGMFLYKGDKNNSLKAVFAPYPKNVAQGGHDRLQELVLEREPFIAKLDGYANFPWRTVIIADKDEKLLDNDMVYKLATPTKQGEDFTWVKPGKVAWDWWNDWNVYGVDFVAGVNNQTYKYYIDFAHKYGVEYVILDEGWTVKNQADLLQVVTDIDLIELIAYANTKNVGIILWAGYYAFNKDIEGLCKHYSNMGVKGFKVDYMDRDDQVIVEFLANAANIAAKYHLLLDFHGVYKPTGLHRTFPNVINFEGVHGLEQLKWADQSVDQVTYDVTLPFIRMLAGPLDYTPGALRNASKENYRPINNEPMSQGTRCHQMAEYVIFESPLSMLCDNPANYMAETTCTEFIANIPTVWEQTVVLNGKIGEYVSIARKNKNEWYAASLNNWNERTIELDLNFLGQGDFQAEVFKDGTNANKVAKDYKKEFIDIPQNKKLNVKLAQGGGFIMHIKQVK
jgi:alpha-glucosidase